MDLRGGGSMGGSSKKPPGVAQGVALQTVISVFQDMNILCETLFNYWNTQDLLSFISLSVTTAPAKAAQLIDAAAEKYEHQNKANLTRFLRNH